MNHLRWYLNGLPGPPLLETIWLHGRTDVVESQSPIDLSFCVYDEMFITVWSELYSCHTRIVHSRTKQTLSEICTQVNGTGQQPQRFIQTGQNHIAKWFMTSLSITYSSHYCFLRVSCPPTLSRIPTHNRPPSLRSISILLFLYCQMFLKKYHPPITF